MKKIILLGLVLLLVSCGGTISDSTNPETSAFQESEHANTPTGTLPSDVTIPVGSLTIVAASNFTDPVASIASLNLGNSFQVQQRIITTDGPDIILRSFFGFLFIINRFGADSVQVIDPITFTIVADYSVGVGSNPQDIVLASEHKAYVARFNSESDEQNSDDLLVIDPFTGEKITSIDLKPYTDAGEGLARAGQMVLVGDKLFVCVADLPENLVYGADTNGKLVVINVETDQFVHVIQLQGRNPADITYSPISKKIYVSNSGVYEDLDTDINDPYGGIEVIDPDTFQSRGIMVDDADLGGYPTEIRIASDQKAFVIVDSKYISLFNPLTYEILNKDFYVSDAYYLPDFSITSNGNLLISERSPTDPGVVIVNGDGEIVSGPIPIGAPPGSITFIDR